MSNDGRSGWRDRAECLLRGLDTVWFFPSSADRNNWDHRALEACAACAVRGECLEWALTHGEVGIWGGVDEHERARLRRQRRRR